MTAVSEKVVVINQKWLQENVNDKANNSFFDHVSDYIGRSMGAFRSLQLSRRLLGLGSEVSSELGHAPSPMVRELDRNLGISLGALGLPRLPSATADAVKSLSELRKDDNVSFIRKAIKAVRDTMDAISAYSYSSIFITGNPALRNVAQVTELTSDFADLQISATDYSKASALEAVATGDAKEALAHTRKYQFLRVLKDVASIATTILGVVLLVTEVTLLPVIALIIVFMSTTIFAIMRDLHKDRGRFKVINFDREVKVC